MKKFSASQKVCKIGDLNVNKELGLDKNKGKDNAHGLTMSEIPPPPPPIDNARFGYV
jgi:hypothetical protein